jgi:hypothetical protein
VENATHACGTPREPGPESGLPLIIESSPESMLLYRTRFPEQKRPQAGTRPIRELGDAVALALLERAENAFLGWQLDAGERYMEQALSRVQESLEQPEPPRSPYFNTCAMAVA